METKILRMSGAGNIFTAVDNRKVTLKIDKWVKLAPLLCSGEYGFKSEGLIVMNAGCGVHEFVTDFLNPDGSSGMMCGNGGRCAVRFAIELGLVADLTESIYFFMAGRTYRSRIENDTITVILDVPRDVNPDMLIPVCNTELRASMADVGTEHVCADIDFTDCNDISKFELEKYGPAVRYHEMFAPRGTNFNIYKVTGKHSITMRTYERGVEAETGACGTGAISVAISAARAGKVELPVVVTPSSGIPITVGISGSPGDPKEVELTGPAIITDSKYVDLNELIKMAEKA